MTLTNLNKAPFPWFGGKRQAAPHVWNLLGDVPHYVEPFAGTMAVLLERPHPCNRPYYSETVNDADGFIVNAWRAIQWSPEATAEAASWPVSEADKQARQIACLQWRTDVMLDRLAGDATFHDPLIAGWWLYGVCCQIGAFAGDGAWHADPVTGRITKQARTPREPGVSRKLPALSNNGQGVNHAGAREPGVSRGLPHLVGDGQGVNRPQLREPGVSRNLPYLTGDGRGVNRPQLREPGVETGDEFHPVTMPELVRWFRWLAARLRHVRIVNGDWTRVVTTGAAHTIPVRQGAGPAGIFLDPPYDSNERAGGLYTAGHDSGNVADDVRNWATVAGTNPRNRIVIAGYDTEHGELEDHGWTVHEWFTAGYLTGGMGNVGDGHQQGRERLWASPACITHDDTQLDLWCHG
jgi:site-specific DNA-adenine methylase